MSIYRLYVRKREAFGQEATRMLDTITKELLLPATKVTIYERYDIEGLPQDQFEKAKHLIFSEPPVDEVFTELPDTAGAYVLASEFVPGQYDQRSDSAEQCLSMLTLDTGYTVRTARIFVIEGSFTAEQKKNYRKILHQPCGISRSIPRHASILAINIRES